MSNHRLRSISSISFILGFLFLVAAVAYTEDAYTTVYLGELRQAHAPRLLGNQLLFTYQQQKPLFAVAIAFGHQDYTRLHYLEKNEYDVFLFLLPIDTIDLELSELQYLYIVDGIWVNDPLNPDMRSDFAGKHYSITSLPRIDRPTTSPIQRGDQTVFFFDPLNRDAVHMSDISGTTYYPNTDQSLVVFLAGSFGGWDPGSYPLQRMEKQNVTYYQLSLPLPSGTYRYYFVVNGVPVLDPLNENVIIEPNGRRTSLLKVP